jgi:hypothetical protein
MGKPNWDPNFDNPVPLSRVDTRTRTHRLKEEQPMTGQELCCVAPRTVALYRENDTGQEEMAGWAMVLGERVVAYVPGRDSVNTGLLNAFSSQTCAERILGYAGLYPFRGWLTLPGAVEAGSHSRPAPAAVVAERGSVPDSACSQR